jgi:hypothetical protein
MTADSKGGVYFTMGGVYYANPQGVVSGRFGTVGGNGIILSPTRRHYASPVGLPVQFRQETGSAGGTRRAVVEEAVMAASSRSMCSDGSLTNERQLRGWRRQSAVDGRAYLPTGGALRP